MLAIVEKFIGPIHQVDSEAKALDLLRSICRLLGARSAMLVEYSAGTGLGLLDTDAVRRAELGEYIGTFGREPIVHTLRWMLSQGRVLQLEEGWPEPGDAFADFAHHRYDLAKGIAVPMSEEGDAAGLIFFSGGHLGHLSEAALLLLCYALFSQIRAFHARHPDAVANPLTPREREVMQLSAEGLTSVQIAGQLGIATRTVNQHVDNVAGKLGTRSRAHTIAELLRHDLLS